MIYSFGEFTIDTGTRQLLAGAAERHISPKAFELLLLLIEARSRAVSKNELQERLWPSTFVGETNLATLVAEIRRALNDSPHESAYVRTVHRFGYRFVAAVSGTVDYVDAARMFVMSAEREFPLSEGATIIGRAHDAGIRVDSGGVSRHHARITVTRAGAQVEDLGSKNGTFVSGKLVDGAQALRDGDEIRVGPVALIFKVSTDAIPTETVY
ncbi:MAG TPA: FHA domain-containing protein [Vicinamibacterales bacterium]|nr:FHA domain-containing protein [Vicinamibacterales bacterium]